MKFFFQKYLNYELANGTSETVEQVKPKANKYVQQYVNKTEKAQIEDQEE